MNKTEFPSYWRYWLRFRVGWLVFIGLILLCSLVVSLVMSASDAPNEYLFWLILWISVLWLSADWWRQRQRFQVVCTIADGVARHTVLPETYETNNQNERLLWEALCARTDQLYAEAARVAQQRQELQDYYTLWAHQIKVPIAAASLLNQRMTDSVEKSLLEQELFKIQQYTDFVLHYLRMETFHRDLVLERVQLDDLVRQTVKKYAPFFIHKQVRLQLNTLNHVVVTDAKWLEVVLEQVLANAIKYTDKGSITIEMVGHYLQVRDTGIGIHESDLPRIFERGFSGYNGRLTQQSSGLGLYLSKQICDQLGLSISIQSQVGVGTTVSLNVAQQSWHPKSD